MAFKGTLKEFTVPDILQMISLQKKTGILTFNSQDSIISISFEVGFICGVDAFPKKLEMRVGHVLVKQDLLSDEMLQRALSIQKRTGQRIGEVLVGMGLIDEKIIPEALKTQATQIVLSLFTWKRGEYNFKALQYLEDNLKTLGPIATDNLIMEGVQMLDEWPMIQNVIPSDGIVFEPVLLGEKKIQIVSEMEEEGKISNEEQVFLTETEVNLLKYVNGQRTVKDLAEMGLFTEYKVYKMLYNLVRKFLIQRSEKTKQNLVREEEAAAEKLSQMTMKSRQMFRLVLLLLLGIFLLTFFRPFRPFCQDQLVGKKTPFSTVVSVQASK